MNAHLEWWRYCDTWEWVGAVCSRPLEYVSIDTVYRDAVVVNDLSRDCKKKCGF